MPKTSGKIAFDADDRLFELAVPGALEVVHISS